MLSRRSLNSKNVSTLGVRMKMSLVNSYVSLINRLHYKGNVRKFTFSRRLALKMDLNPNWKYSKSNGKRDAKSI